MYLEGHRIAQNPERPCPDEIFRDIVGVSVRFASVFGGEDEGIIEIHRDLVSDIEAFFSFMFSERFPLSLVRPVVEFDWSDLHSMTANNTSGFNYRTYWTVEGTRKLSQHAFGRAIDINPLFNPEIRNGKINPPAACYRVSRPGTLVAESPVTLFLKDRGWTWGGDFVKLKDYQHFEKPA